MNVSEEDELSFASSILLNEENDFPSKGHHLNRWYFEYFLKQRFGVQNFIVISSDEKFQHIDENLAHFILSALSIALNNLSL
jgi:hypothetical protein